MPRCATFLVGVATAHDDVAAFTADGAIVEEPKRDVLCRLEVVGGTTIGCSVDTDLAPGRQEPSSQCAKPLDKATSVLR